MTRRILPARYRQFRRAAVPHKSVLDFFGPGTQKTLWERSFAAR
jgi:hypothetical protein